MEKLMMTLPNHTKSFEVHLIAFESQKLNNTKRPYVVQKAMIFVVHLLLNMVHHMDSSKQANNERADMADKSTYPPLTQKHLANSNAPVPKRRDFLVEIGTPNFWRN